MKKKYVLFILIAGLITFLSCTINKLNNEKTVITLETNSVDNPTIISVTKGAQWSHKFTPGPFIIHIYPQIVFWIENDKENFFETLYITGANGKYSKNATKNNLDDEFFKLCFPVWTSRTINANKKLPTKEEPYTDAVTSPTPQSSFDLNISLGKIPAPFTIYAEINKSGDYNETYTKESTDWIGQPSIVYANEISEINKNQKYHLKPIGRSGIPSDSTGFYLNLEGIDTALELVSDISVIFK